MDKMIRELKHSLSFSEQKINSAFNYSNKTRRQRIKQNNQSINYITCIREQKKQ